jgi:NHL repeat
LSKALACYHSSLTYTQKLKQKIQKFQYLAANVKFSSISSIAVTPDGILYIADVGNNRLRSVSSSIPPEKSDGVFEVPDTDAQVKIS